MTICMGCKGSGCEQVAMGHGNIDVVDCSLCFGAGEYPAFIVAKSDCSEWVDVAMARNELDCTYANVKTIGLDGVA